MPNKSDYIRIIISTLSSVSEDIFQSVATTVLRFYYRQNNLQFEKVGAAGGDFKNDGWIPEKCIFYQIYSPVQFSSSFISNLYNKFKNDFAELSKYVFEKHKWNGDIKEFYFLVNTRDGDIPRDDERIVETTQREIESKYNVSFNTVKIINKDYLIDLLVTLNEEQLRDLVDTLGISGALEVIDVTPRGFIEFINIMCNTFLSHSYEGTISSMVKIPDEEKIILNDLQDRGERINKISAHLGAVEEAIDIFTKSSSNEKKVQKIIDYCVNVYRHLKQSLHGSQLYDGIIDEIVSYLPQSDNQRNNVELLIVYIFDRCDIFERTNNATTE